MRESLAYLIHALRMLVHEPATTLRVLQPALVLLGGASIAAATVAPDFLALSAQDPESLVLPTPGKMLTGLLLAVLALLGYALVAILWHRHVLLDGPEQLRPDGGIVLSYIWRAILVGLVQMAISIPVIFLISAFGASGMPVSLLGILAAVFFVWVALRLSVILPAAALGETMTIRQSWETTAPSALPLLWLALWLLVINSLISAGIALLVTPATPFGIALGTLAYLVEGLIFISVLTTLYGHLVQRRPLS
ncbi:hypothetical protein ACFSUD_02930 [Sulfitobacter aestuarii]|uniref:DUF4013 domain-containing protein n=1 Tax=Sulfitobacter aestuarii TaxID=2161676 RepID=A0ABW5TYI8_9RHOB